MQAEAPEGSRRSISAVAFVAALHALTLPLTWVGTDQGEMIFTAQRLVEHGTLILAQDSARPVPGAPWAPRLPGQPVRSRLHPGTPVLWAPFVLVDRVLGYRDPQREGLVTYLQGLAFVTASLALLGYSLRALRVPDQHAAIAVLFVGTSSPLWTVGRNCGAEPVLALLLLAYAAAGELARDRGEPERFLGIRAFCLGALPWVHPSGMVLAPALGAATLLMRREPRRVALRLAAAGAFGTLAFALLWNQAYHGHWLVGGYHLVGGMTNFSASVFYGAWTLLRDLAHEAPIVMALALWAARREGGRAAAAWQTPALALLVLLALFATLYERDASRRFAVAIPLLGFPLGLGWARLAWPLDRVRLLVFASIAWGLHRLLAVFGAYYEGPDGLFYPAVVWVKLAIDHGWSARWLLPVAAILAALFVLWRRVFPARARAGKADEQAA